MHENPRWLIVAQSVEEQNSKEDVNQEVHDLDSEDDSEKGRCYCIYGSERHPDFARDLTTARLSTPVSIHVGSAFGSYSKSQWDLLRHPSTSTTVAL